jgi:DNA-binding beta-propeller fold protein YncE
MAASLQPLKTVVLAACLVSLAACTTMNASPAKRELMVVGNDEKVGFSDAGAFVFSGPGKDTVSIIDIGTDPLAPRILVNLSLTNSIFGPPVNLAITPDESLALVANSVNAEKDGAGWKMMPDNKLYVIDLTTDPPALIDTVTVGKQPSGMSINRAGNLALVTNRADNSIAVLRIAGKKVTVVDTVEIGEQVTHVVFTPDGKRAMAAKFPGNKLALLEVNGEKITYTKQDIPVGLWPYNFDIAPDGKLAISADNGAAGRSDGNVDTVTVIDLEANPPRVIDKVVVGDSPEGFAISPTGKLAVALLLNGNGKVVALKIDGKKVTRSNEVEVRGLPEGLVFSNDGRYIYVGNYLDRDISILRVDGDQIVNTGKSLALPGQPASMRARTR